MQVQLCAVVTEPTVTVSADALRFDMLQCGMCQVARRAKPVELTSFCCF